MKNILLTGSNGYIAKGIYDYLGLKYNIIKINRNIFDLTNYEFTKDWFKQTDLYFDVIIHTAISGGNRLVTESSETLDNNLRMYLNLLEFRSRYDKFINMGSGAEYNLDSFYGLSKKVIDRSMYDKNKFYNLRIYGLFDHKETDRRFIKSNIQRYINQENIIIHSNKYMDFIYFPDFIQIIRTYIESSDLPKTFDCVYDNKYSLIDIAQIINKLDRHSVDIEIKNSINDSDYIGSYYNLNIPYLGLAQGILQTYRKIKDEKNMVCPQ